jgi:nucleolar protein 58
VVSKLKGDAHKYKGIPVRICWLRAYKAAVSNHHVRIEKEKLLWSLVKKAKKAYEVRRTPRLKVKKAKKAYEVRRSPRLNRKLYEEQG